MTLYDAIKASGVGRAKTFDAELGIQVSAQAKPGRRRIMDRLKVYSYAKNDDQVLTPFWGDFKKLTPKQRAHLKKLDWEPLQPIGAIDQLARLVLKRQR